MELYVLDREFNILGVVSTYDSIIWNSKFHEPGNFKASFLFTKKMNQMLKNGNLIYKTDEEEPVIITRKYLKLNKNGEETIVIQGYTASRYLNQRIVWNKMILSGTPETVMRDMVYENAVNPDDSYRKIPRLELGELKGYEGHIEKQVSYDNLQESLTDLSKTSELGYRLILDISDKKLYFDVFKGIDRTLGTEKPCIFTRQYGNVYTQEYSEDITNYRNVCLVGGAGEDTSRIMQTVGNASGLDRYELFYNAAGISNKEITEDKYLQQLTQKGEEKLTNYYIAKAFENKINQEKAMAYKLGDYVTCTDPEWDVTVDTQIKEISKGFSKEEKSLFITFGDDVPTLISLIKAKE